MNKAIQPLARPLHSSVCTSFTTSSVQTTSSQDTTPYEEHSFLGSASLHEAKRTGTALCSEGSAIVPLEGEVKKPKRCTSRHTSHSQTRSSRSCLFPALTLDIEGHPYQLHITTRGELYYINAKGLKCYLSAPQIDKVMREANASPLHQQEDFPTLTISVDDQVYPVHLTLRGELYYMNGKGIKCYLSASQMEDVTESDTLVSESLVETSPSLTIEMEDQIYDVHLSARGIPYYVNEEGIKCYLSSAQLEKVHGRSSSLPTLTISVEDHLYDVRVTSRGELYYLNKKGIKCYLSPAQIREVKRSLSPDL